MDIRTLLIVGMGSFVGGCLRYVSIVWIDKKATGDFPLSVLAINAIGSLLIAFLLPLYSRYDWAPDSSLPLFLSVGLLGGYTTFSTFSLQTLRLMQNGQVGLAALNASASVAACLIAAYCGWKLGNLVWG